MSNYPAGATTDPRAPWRDHGMSEYCRYCDEDQIAELIPEDADHREVKIDALKDRAGLCPDCHAEYMADWMED